MALKLYVLYTTADNEIVWAQYADEATPPTADVGQDLVVLDGPPGSGFPSSDTHKIDPGPPVAVIAKTQNEQDDIQNGRKREALRRRIATLEACKDKFNAESPPWDTAALQADIDALRADHNELP